MEINEIVKTEILAGINEIVKDKKSVRNKRNRKREMKTLACGTKQLKISYRKRKP